MAPNRKVLPPMYLLAAMLLMAVLNYLAPVKTVVNVPITYIGAGLIAVGLFVVIWPAASFGKAGTPIKPFEESTQLITDGMYRLTRNPMYLGMVTVLLGIAVLFGSLSPFIVVPIFAWLIQMNFIRFEEAQLEEIFGDDYLAYKRNVRRWL